MDARRKILAPELQRKFLILILVMTAFLSGCRSTPQTVKIGVVAPFEGRYREIGYATIPAIRLAVREWEAQNPESTIALEVIAYDDRGNPELARQQAEKLILDPDVGVVIGHWLNETTVAALPVYASAELPVVTYSESPLEYDFALYNLAPPQELLSLAADEWRIANNATLLEDWQDDLELKTRVLEQHMEVSDQASTVLAGSITGELHQFYALSEGNADGLYFVTGTILPIDSKLDSDQSRQFSNDFRVGSGDIAPGLLSLTAYWAAKIAIEDIMLKHFDEQTASMTTEQFMFDEHGRRLNAPIYLYKWFGGEQVFVDRLH